MSALRIFKTCFELCELYECLRPRSTDLALGRRGHGAAGTSQLHSVCAMARAGVRTRERRAENDEIVDVYLVNPIMYLTLEAEYQYERGIPS